MQIGLEAAVAIILRQKIARRKMYANEDIGIRSIKWCQFFVIILQLLIGVLFNWIVLSNLEQTNIVAGL